MARRLPYDTSPNSQPIEDSTLRPVQRMRARAANMDSTLSTTNNLRTTPLAGRIAIEGTDLMVAASALHWYEAVAVVLQLAEGIEQSGTRAVPDLAQIRVAPDGTVTFPPASRPSVEPARQLAVALKSLLPAEGTPPRLLEVVNEVVEKPSHREFGDFVQVLHYFERPDRRQVLRQMVPRINSFAVETRTNQELERITAKVRAAAMAGSQARQSRWRWRLTVTAVLVAGVLIGGAVVVWSRSPFLPSAAGSAVSSAVTRASRSMTTAFDSSVGQLFGRPASEPLPKGTSGAAPAPQPDKMNARSKPAPRTAATQSARAAAVSDTTAAHRSDDAPAAAEPPPAMTDTPEPTLLAAPVIGVSPSDMDPAPGRIYNRFDSGVTAPVPLAPFIGHVTLDPTVMPGDMNVLVDRNGTVERVTLLAPNRYQDLWLVFAIKNHQFKPAFANGRPVRYMMRMRTAS